MDVPPGEEKFDDFYKDLKETEQKDSVLTPKQQIDRLLRPGEKPNDQVHQLGPAFG